MNVQGVQKLEQLGEIERFLVGGHLEKEVLEQQLDLVVEHEWLVAGKQL